MTDLEFVRREFPAATGVFIEPLTLVPVFHGVPGDVSAVRVTFHDRVGRSSSLRRGRRFFLFNNSFIASFFRYLAIGSLYAKYVAKTLDERDAIAIDRFRTSIRRTQAEIMYARHPSLPSVSQFIVALIEDEQGNRDMYAWLGLHPEAERSATFFVRFAMELIFSHELAHCCQHFDRRHFDIVAEDVQRCMNGLEENPLFAEEVECDIFAIHSCMATYRNFGFDQLEKCVEFAILAQFAYAAMTQNAEKFLEEHDPQRSYQRPLDTGPDWLPQERYTACRNYLKGFSFRDDPMFPKPPTGNIETFDAKLEWVIEAFEKLDDVQCDGHRAAARLLAQGFLSGLPRPFDEVANNASQMFTILLNQGKE